MRWTKEGRELNDGETRKVRKFLFRPFTDHEWTRFSVGSKQHPDIREWKKTTYWLAWVTMIQRYDRRKAVWENWQVLTAEESE